MNAGEYLKIQKFCNRFLVPSLKGRHLEDMVQYVAMKYWEKSGVVNLNWLCIDYLRDNGIGERGKVGAQTLEKSILVGLSSDENEDLSENGFLFDAVANERHKDSQIEKDGEVEFASLFLQKLEEIILPLNLNQETFKWVKKTYQPKLSKTKEKIFNISRKRFT